MYYKIDELSLAKIRQYLYNAIPTSKGGELLELWGILNKLELLGDGEDMREESEDGRKKE